MPRNRRLPPILPFSDCPGIFQPLLRSPMPSQLCIPRNTSLTPYSYFRLFLTDLILNLICQWTNQNALLNNTPAWQTLTNKELLAFFGIEIYMANYRQSGRESYWSTKEPQPTHYWILDLMPRNRYRQIWQFLRFQDPLIKTHYVFDKVQYPFLA